ncbi:hypothetical protein TNIN_389461 [Trichonephila inaurata madagascariensis]|uniref:Uncharacterized protein n=1 Tax=Trichonephila inaurata madagascariensis TaxID=2747483 RepID=A0A8X6WR98_9ARAC|nr:hypothetical protein TNIN_389461 [Trichonephila inaurata madagascariensis]
MGVADSITVLTSASGRHCWSTVNNGFLSTGSIHDVLHMLLQFTQSGLGRGECLLTDAFAYACWTRTLHALHFSTAGASWTRVGGCPQRYDGKLKCLF